MRAVIADGDRFYRDGLALLLRESGIDVVGEVSTGEAALDAVQQTAPDVAIMDFDVPGLSGLEAIQRMRERAPDTGLLVLSHVAQEAAVTDAIRARGGAYLLKDRPIREIVAAVRKAAARPAGEG